MGPRFPLPMNSSSCAAETAEEGLADHLFQEALRATAGASRCDVFITVRDKRDGFKIVMHLPGVAADELDVRIDADLLVVAIPTSQHLHQGAASPEGQSFRGFARVVQLPYSPPPELATAVLLDGVLSIDLPHAGECQL